MFFFEAEDGIRYRYVTGVQTCALPIFMSLIVFGSLTASVMIAVPAILSALVVAGGLGA